MGSLSDQRNLTFLSQTDDNIMLQNIAWIEGFAILLAVFIVAGVGSWNDW